MPSFTLSYRHAWPLFDLRPGQPIANNTIAQLPHASTMTLPTDIETPTPIAFLIINMVPLRAVHVPMPSAGWSFPLRLCMAARPFSTNFFEPCLCACAALVMHFDTVFAKCHTKPVLPTGQSLCCRRRPMPLRLLWKRCTRTASLPLGFCRWHPPSAAISSTHMHACTTSCEAYLVSLSWNS